jgi:predicted  nucleic acid-binding Zn-ribbon protein
MPHQCTDCGRTFDDGSKAMLGGCPNCGGNTFQFRPDGAPADQPEEPPDPPEPAVDGVARTVGNAATAVRDLVGGSSSGPGSPSQSPSEDDAQASARSDFVPSEHLPSSPSRDRSTSNWSSSDADGRTPPGPPGARTDSDAASDSTRTDTDAPGTTRSPDNADDTRADTDAGTDVDDGSADTTAAGADESSRPELSELREELNDQFESIRVLEPGQYELNLMELYDREEYIIALQEDGKYTIQVPERWNE